MRIFTDGQVFGGGKIFRNFPGSYTVDVKTGEVVAHEFIEVNPRDQKGRRTARIFFNETEATLSEEFLLGLKVLPGVMDVTVEFAEGDFFRGTTLTLEYEEDYVLNYSFNHEGYSTGFEDFVISGKKLAS